MFEATELVAGYRDRTIGMSVSPGTHLETPVGCDILFLGNNQEQESCAFVN